MQNKHESRNANQMNRRAAKRLRYPPPLYKKRKPKLETRTLTFNDANFPPPVARGSDKAFLVDVTRARNGQSYTFPAIYLNEYPLWFEYENEERECTGWYSIETGDPDESQYHKLHMDTGDTLNSWAEIPQRKESTAPGSNISSLNYLNDINKRCQK